MKPIPTRKLISKPKFNAWLAKQPDNRTFDFTDNDRCMFASFLNETNPGEEFGCGTSAFNHRSADWTTHKFPQWAVDISFVLAKVGNRFSVQFVCALLEFKNT